MHNISHAKKGLNMSDATISKLFHPGSNATRIFKNIKKLLFFNSNSGTNATSKFKNIKKFLLCIQYMDNGYMIREKNHKTSKV